MNVKFVVEITVNTNNKVRKQIPLHGKEVLP